MQDKLREQINIYIMEIAKGNENALDNLSRAISSRMMAIAMSILHNRQLAEEALQDSFLKIVMKAHAFKQGTNGYAWICKIVQNASLNVLRAERRHKGVSLEECFSLATNDDVFDVVSQNIQLKNAMKTLTKYEQVAIYQKYFMDYTVRDIAKDMGKSRSSTQRIIDLAEEKIKKFLNCGTNGQN